MQIIGAGFGRTGTLSMRAALVRLGFGPCYHMLEVFRHPGHVKYWRAALDGEEVDWQDFLGSYGSGVDYPLSNYYRQLMAAFPDAKVLLTVRDPQRWYESTRATIYQAANMPSWLPRLVPPMRKITEMVNGTVWEGLFGGRFEERDYAIQVFEEHIAEVKRVVPSDRLLVFSVKEGWEPLCEFLGVEIPDEPFPHVNDRKTMTRALSLLRLLPVGFALVVIGLLALLAVNIL